MYHYLPLHIGSAFSHAEGNNVAWIRNYPRFLRLVFPRKDFVKMKGGGELVKITPCPFIDHHLILRNIFLSREGDSREWGLPILGLPIIRNGSIVCKQKHGECAASEVLSELAFCP